MVQSPLGAILAYELAHKIPPGYINATIAANAPHGSWQQLERGAIPLDDAFFARFRAELTDERTWRAYWAHLLRDPRRKKAAEDAGLLDRVGADGVPVRPDVDAKGMFWNMMRAAREPDGYMVPALRRLRDSGRFVLAGLSNTIDFPEGVRDERGDLFRSGVKKVAGDGEVDAERVDIRTIFDVFVSSAHVGMRKPEREIYELALREVDRAGQERGMGGIEARDICFIDDIGTNLKAAKALGMRTIKVPLGKSRQAVEELEAVVGMSLIEDSSRI